MTENNLMDPMQSAAYRKGHSTETALLRVHKWILSVRMWTKGMVCV